MGEMRGRCRGDAGEDAVDLLGVKVGVRVRVRVRGWGGSWVGVGVGIRVRIRTRVGVGVGVRVRVRARARAAATSVSRFCSLRLGEIQARYREVYLAPPSRASAACG